MRPLLLNPRVQSSYRFLRQCHGARLLRLTAACLPLLTGCAGGLFATVGPNYEQPDAKAPATWHAPLQPGQTPHQGSTQSLAQWWAQFNDRTLDALIAAAQAQSGNVAQAAAAIERARAEAIAAGVAGNPNLDGIATSNRSAFTLGGPLALRTQQQLGVQSAWEIDLFGGLAREREAREASLQANISTWHEARVSLAAEVANAYLGFRYCEVLVSQNAVEARSRAQTARISAGAAKAGLLSNTTAALTEGAAADAASALLQRRAQCDIGIKGLVALTAIDEPAMRAVLMGNVSAAAKLPEPTRISIDAVPARVIAQRPDIAAAERQLAAASAEIGANEANRYPRLTLSGNILATRIQVGTTPALSLTPWSIGPSLQLPLLDGGRRQANVDAARAQYAAAESVYRAKVRNAVREVEEALVRLASNTSREVETQNVARAYRANFVAAENMFRVGLGSALELEEARRLALAAEVSLVSLAQERVAAWIALYRAVGGGWEADSPKRAQDSASQPISAPTGSLAPEAGLALSNLESTEHTP
ncbi:MAG: efflux transporter outer membrane subunit [Burkholderiales bacterium]